MLHPHGSCYLWNPWLTSLNAAGDLLIALAYFAIPITITLQRHRLPSEWKPLLFCTALFILGCGATHLLDTWNIWHTAYWLEGTIKLLVAFISLYTAYLLPKDFSGILDDKVLLNQILDNTPDGIMVMRPVQSANGGIMDFVYERANPACLQILEPAIEQMSDRAIIGHTHWELFPGDNGFENYVAVSQTGKTYQAEVRYQGAGIDSWFAVASVSLTGGRVGIIFRDISQSKLMVHQDDLTGLNNDRYLKEVINPDEIKSYLYIDLDRFKTVNDAYGHMVGDEVLRQVGDRLLRIAGEKHVAVRLHGDEFALLMKSGNALTKAGEIVYQIERPFHVGDLELRLSASVGIAYSHEESIEGGLMGMRTNADIAMYQGKFNRDAGSRIFVYEPGMAIRISEEKKIEEELRRAIDRQEFILYYQPIVRLIPGYPVVGFEALIRWNHPTKGILSPVHFIPVAEQTGLIGKICDWVFTEAFAKGREWSQQRGQNLKMGINLSALDLERQSFLELVRVEILNMPGFAGVPFFEVTESALGIEREITSFLTEIQGLGSKFGIDDFGTGYSTLSRLNKLKKLLSAIKVDRSFLELENQALYQIIVKAAKVLDLEIIAEGVETKAQLDLLRSLDCEYGQGYYFYRPMPASDVEAQGLI